jgi:hypothetical protein
MLSNGFGHVRHNVVAYVALFFALSGGAMAANTYIRSTDTIPAGSDLAGSTYGNPLIASGAVTNTKLANSSLSVSPGTGLSGGGSVALGGSTTLGVASGGIGTTQLADSAVTTSKFNSAAQAPDSAKLAGASPSDYGAVLSGRVQHLGDVAAQRIFGAASGISNGSGTEANVTTLSPDRDLKARDLSIQLTQLPGQTSTLGLVVNGALALHCDISGSDTTCAASGPVDVPADSTLSIEDLNVYNVVGGDALFAFRLTNS